MTCQALGHLLTRPQHKYMNTTANQITKMKGQITKLIGMILFDLPQRTVNKGWDLSI